MALGIMMSHPGCVTFWVCDVVIPDRHEGYMKRQSLHGTERHDPHPAYVTSRVLCGEKRPEGDISQHAEGDGEQAQTTSRPPFDIFPHLPTGAPPPFSHTHAQVQCVHARAHGWGCVRVSVGVDRWGGVGRLGVSRPFFDGARCRCRIHSVVPLDI